ncbi:MAG: dihydroorotase [Porphyromonadaceae bacterium]|nr:dihydroorotase [Porphyromonadaceae bacterium]
MKKLIKNANIVNEGQTFKGSVLICNELIERVLSENEVLDNESDTEIIDADGLWLFPGVIDDQVHFRDPGLTHKGDIYTESKAAVAGGVTSFMDMPNTNPQTTTYELLEQKYELGKQKSLANFSFFMGATNTNVHELLKINPKNVCGIKVFMGSSTGNMLVNDVESLERIFNEAPTLVAVHCEDEQLIQSNTNYFKSIYGDNLSADYHPLIRSSEVCYKSSSFAVELARRYNTKLHILHISTAKELALFDNKTPLRDKKITAEVCVHHLWFSDADYKRLGNKIKWNPAIKKSEDREALIQAVNSNLIDVVATDHAPHTKKEKSGNCFTAASGGPLVQHSLIAMLQLAKKGKFTVEKVVEKMCHAPADLFRIEKRGYIRPGYYADLVLVNPQSPHTVSESGILSKCGWSPFEGVRFDSKVEKTFVNGNLVYDKGVFHEATKGMRLLFEN